MTSQVQHAQRIVAMVDSFMADKSATGGNCLHITRMRELFGFNTLGEGNFGFAIQHPSNPDLAIKVVLGDPCYSTDRKLQLCCGYIDYVAVCMAAPKSKHIPEFHAAVVGKTCAVVVMKKYRRSSDAGWHAQEAFGEIVRDISDPGLDFVKAKLGRFNDVHSGNYMWDSDTQEFVITDPYAIMGNSKAPCERWIGKDGVITVDVEFGNVEPDKQVTAIADILPATAPKLRRFVHNGPNIQQLPRELSPEFERMRKAMINDFMVPRHLMFLTTELNKRRRMFVHNARNAHIQGRAMDFVIKDDFDLEARNHHVRRELADDSEKPTLRAQEKDHVLRLKSEHDCGARIKGVSGALLSGRKPWWVPAIWPAKLGRADGTKARDREPTDEPVVRVA